MRMVRIACLVVGTLAALLAVGTGVTAPVFYTAAASPRALLVSLLYMGIAAACFYRFARRRRSISSSSRSLTGLGRPSGTMTTTSATRRTPRSRSRPLLRCDSGCRSKSFQDEDNGDGFCLDTALDHSPVVFDQHDWYDGGTGENGHHLADSLLQFYMDWAPVCFQIPSSLLVADRT